MTGTGDVVDLYRHLWLHVTGPQHASRHRVEKDTTVLIGNYINCYIDSSDFR